MRTLHSTLQRVAIAVLAVSAARCSSNGSAREGFGNPGGSHPDGSTGSSSSTMSTSSGGVDATSGGGEDAGVEDAFTGGSSGSGGSGGGSSSGSAGSSGSGGSGGPSNCGGRAGMRGETFRTLTGGGTPRTYYAYLPSSANATKPAPLVLVMHGATMSGKGMIAVTGFESVADSEGIAVAFLDGQGTNSMTGTSTLDPWNVSDNGAAVCGAGALANNPTANVDFEFLDAIKTDIAQDQCIDTAHVFATGFSMGGYFSHHVGCDRTDIRAVAPHSGGTIASLSACKTGHVPAIIFHGTADGLIGSGCDDPNGSAQAGFPASATLWAEKNGCKTTYQTLTETGTGGNNGQCYLYDGCPGDGQVELCTFTNLGHAWAGSTMCPGCIGTGANYPSATQLEWAFFKKYAW